MKLLLIPAAAMALTACAPTPPTCGPVPAVIISHTKAGFPIYDDQAPILPPCGGHIHTQPGGDKPPVPEPPLLPEPPYMPPVDQARAKGDNGWGNGDQDAPGGSAPRNRAENAGGNRNGRRASPGRSWHG